MLVIRLSRTGRKKQPYYRVVVAEKSAPIKGRLIEVLGHFNPRTKELEIDVERAKARVKDGAQPSETAEFLLEKAGVLKREAITEKNRRPEQKSKKVMKAEAEDDGKPKTEAVAPADSEAKPDDASEAKAEAKTDDAVKGDAKPEAKSDDTPEVKKEEKPGPKVEAKAEDKPEAKADDTAKNESDTTNDDKGEST